MLSKIGVLLLSLFFFSAICQEKRDYKIKYQKAEQLYNLEENTEETDSLALLLYKEVIQMDMPKDSIEAFYLYDSYIKAGRLEQTYGLSRIAIGHYQEGILLSKDFGFDDSTRFHPNIFIGMAYYFLQEIDSSIFYLEQAEKITQNDPSIGEQDQLYNSLGVIYYGLGNYQQSINYFDKAIRITPFQPNYSKYLISSYKSNIASALRRLGRHDSAIAIYREMLPSNINADKIKTNLGGIYLEIKQPDSALHYLQQVDDNSAAYINNKAEAYLQKDQLDKAIQLLSNVLDIQTESYGGNIAQAKTFRLLGNAYRSKGQLVKSLEHYQRSLNELLYDFENESIFSNPQGALSLNVFSLFETLSAKAGAFEQAYMENNMPSYKQGAMDTYESAIRVSDFIIKYTDNDDSRIFTTSKVFPIYQRAVAYLLSLHEIEPSNAYLEKAFVWSEKSKANALAINLKESALKKKSHLPDTLLSIESNLKFELSQLTKRLSRVKTEEENELIGNKIRDVQIQLSRIRDRFNDYPDFFNEKFAYDSIKLDLIKDQLASNDKTLISYFFTVDALQVFTIKDKKISHFSTRFEEGEAKLLNDFIEALHHVDGGFSFNSNETGKGLFRLLLEPVVPFIKSEKSLVIIPHQHLSMLPFESLIDHNGKFIIQSFDITYQLAASFINYSSFDQPEFSKSLVVAPFAKEGAQGLSPLRASMDEVKSLGGTRLIGEDASKSMFLRYVEENRIIHLATHATVNDMDPSASYIVFYPDDANDLTNRLFVHEVSNLKLDTVDLAFLSACETASGRLADGEGILGISRAFTKAGCKNVITSLWKAEDHSTAYISDRFYTYLGKGFNSPQALRLAKIDLLNDPSYSQFKSPNYWSHLVLIGQIPKKNGIDYQLFWIAGVFILIIGSLYLSRRSLIRISNQRVIKTKI